MFQPATVTLRDGKPATIFPVRGGEPIPDAIFKKMNELFNREIEDGQTYPYENPLTPDEFRESWTSKFCAIMVPGHVKELQDDAQVIGTFYIKPNYIGRCSHICNAGFLVNPDFRGAGVGIELAKQYLIWAPQLGYVYSMFNLVFVTNKASLRIWDNMGFDRIGYIKGAGRLRNHEELVDAVQFGKALL